MDYHLIMDLVPVVARIFFLKQLGDMSLSAAQCVSFKLVVLLFSSGLKLWSQKCVNLDSCSWNQSFSG